MAGKEEAADQNEQFYRSSWTFTSTPQQHAQPPPAAVGRSVSMEQAHYAFGHQSAEPTSDLSDQPLDFAPRFSRDHDPHVQHNYTHDSGVPFRGVESVAAVPSIHAWTSPAAPGAIYPSVHSSGSQVDPSLGTHSPAPGHSGPLFGRMPGQNFQPIIPPVSASFGVSTGTFQGDAYGASGVSDRPKKASVPNWLREEIIKKKSVIATSAPELGEEETKSIEEEAVDKSISKGDLADIKSIDSSRSTEEDDDEEDDVEAARTAAINQEIKRVLTEVLLKVTDELFDEIATKVLGEDDLTVAVDNSTATSNYEVSSSTPAVPISKASAKVLITAKTNETDSDDVSGKSNSSAPGDVLGLGSYASDDDEDDDIQNFVVPNSSRSTIHQQSTKTLPDDLAVVGNGSSLAEARENHKINLTVESHPGRVSPNGTSGNNRPVVSELNNNGSGKESMQSTIRSRYFSKTEFLDANGETKNISETVVDGADVSMSKNNVEEKVVMKNELSVENVSAKKSTSDDNEGRETRNKPDKNNRYDSKRSSAGKDLVKEAEGDRVYVRGDESHGRHDERKVKKEKRDDQNGSKEKMKEQGLKSREDTDSKRDRRTRSSQPDDKEGRKEREKDRRTSGKEGNDRKRERTNDEKGERSRHKLASDSSKHKRHRSSSVGSRGRDGKNHAVASHSNDSSDDSSDNSRRKLHSRKRKLSPSPVRSRRRQVSRSPHSKHSQRRHSAYSSLEPTRGKRSRSRSKSPARRKR